jgi:hypothetical protein
MNEQIQGLPAKVKELEGRLGAMAATAPARAIDSSNGGPTNGRVDLVAVSRAMVCSSSLPIPCVRFK